LLPPSPQDRLKKTFSDLMVLDTFLYGFLAALAITPVVRFFAKKKGILDRPDGARKRHAAPTPLLGGVAVFAAFALAVGLSLGGLLGGFLPAKHLIGILCGGLILVVGGYLDDRYDLPPRVQILFPTAAALAVIASGIGASVITDPLGGVLHLDAWQWTVFSWRGAPYRLTLPADLFTFAWMMGMMYTTKLLDGLDGLVSGLGVIGFTVLAVYSLSPLAAEPELARLAMGAAGASGGFLFYNARPASIFLGEGGSTLIGYLLGVLAILAGGKIGVTLMILAVPIMDAAWTIVRRLLQRRSVAQAGRDHLHFLLVRQGLSPGKTTLLFWLFAAGFGGIGQFIGGWQKLLALAILGILYAAVAFILSKRHHGKPAS